MVLTDYCIRNSGNGFNASVLRGFAKAACARGIDPDLLIKAAQAFAAPTAQPAQSPVYGPRMPTPASAKPFIPAVKAPAVAPVIPKRTYTQVNTGYRGAFDRAPFLPVRTDPRSPMAALFAQPAPGTQTVSPANKPYAYAPVVGANPNLKIEGGPVNPMTQEAIANADKVRREYLQKQLEVAKWRHRISGSAEPFDPRKHFTLYDLAGQYENEVMPYNPFGHDISRYGRFFGAKADQGLRNVMRQLPGLWGGVALPPEVLSKEVKNRWLGGGDYKDLYNPFSAAYQRLYGSDPTRTTAVSPYWDPETGESSAVDVQGNPYQGDSLLARYPRARMVGDTLVLNPAKPTYTTVPSPVTFRPPPSVAL